MKVSAQCFQTIPGKRLRRDQAENAGNWYKGTVLDLLDLKCQGSVIDAGECPAPYLEFVVLKEKVESFLKLYRLNPHLFFQLSEGTLFIGLAIQNHSTNGWIQTAGVNVFGCRPFLDKQPSN